jgi:hypothetical protein
MLVIRWYSRSFLSTKTFEEGHASHFAVEEYASAPTKFVLMNVDGRFFAGLTPSGRAVWAGIVYAKVVDGNFQSGVKLDAVALPAPWYLINGVN